MSERPIIMSVDSVRAILDGRKTQTRRVMKVQPQNQGALLETAAGELWYTWPIDDGREHYCKCPFGKPGDRLWVRETWGYITKAENEFFTHRRPDGCPVEMYYKPEALVEGWAHDVPWSSPIHMPRWASRITLEIVTVRVERVQEISRADAYAEGIRPGPGEIYYGYAIGDPVIDYADLWDQLNAKRGYAWKSNPWVWVIEFKRREER